MHETYTVKVDSLDCAVYYTPSQAQIFIDDGVFFCQPLGLLFFVRMLT